MNVVVSRRRAVTTVVCFFAALAGTGLAPFRPSTAAAFVADSCGLLRQESFARAFAQAEASTSGKMVKLPGNSAGVVRDQCVVLAWSGHQPRTPRQERRQFLDGSAAGLKIETWVADETAAAETWRHNFGPRVKALTSHARRTFLEGIQKGKVIVALPRLGAEHSLGFQASRGGLVKVRAFWWNAQVASIVEMTVIESKALPAASSLRRIASTVVPEIH